MSTKLKLIAGVLLATPFAGTTIAGDHKRPEDKCPPGRHAVTIERSTTVEARPGGVGGGHTVTEKFNVCRDNKGSRVKESVSGNRPN